VHTILVLFGLFAAAEVVPAPTPEPLSFREFFEPGARSLKPSARLLALEGKRVRLVGYMARMEMPPQGGFYLCSSPVLATEGGGGTADLPPDAVLVLVRSAAGKELGHIPRPLEVTGTLELGPSEDQEGRVSMIRILLEGPPVPVPSPPPSSPR
jgi:hypothetical protein